MKKQIKAKKNKYMELFRMKTGEDKGLVDMRPEFIDELDQNLDAPRWLASGAMVQNAVRPGYYIVGFAYR